MPGCLRREFVIERECTVEIRLVDMEFIDFLLSLFYRFVALYNFLFLF